MRSPILPLVLLGILSAVGPSCGSADDPLATRCEAACGNVSAPSPCANDTAKGKCLNDCRALASQATTSNGKACGECIADSFKYSASATECWGTGHASPTDADCRSKCFEPDGGVGF
jgi:hypothetical protein